MKSFDAERDGTGTAEWADVNENICLGCANNCLYCYAAYSANRFKRRPRAEWHMEELTKRAEMSSYPSRNGVIMFPSSHDITPFNVVACVRVLRMMLSSGNQVLIVTKPRLMVMLRLINDLAQFKEQILFRFTIGTMNAGDAEFWEPGASSPLERVTCLKWAQEEGFRTSVSVEPLLGGVQTAKDVVKTVADHVTDTIWIGKLNKPRLRVCVADQETERQLRLIEIGQTDLQVQGIYAALKNNPKVRWKDSIREVVARKGKNHECS